MTDIDTQLALATALPAGLELPVVLASGSPRRRELLTQVGIPHQTLAVLIDETPQAGEAPTVYIRRMVSEKAQAAGKALASLSLESQGNTPDRLVITADTIGVLDGKILQKPRDLPHAMAMWQAMSGTTHEVWSAVQVSRFGGSQSLPLIAHEQALVVTEVTFRPLTQAQLLAYWQTGEPQDKAGGYAIQGLGAAWVQAICGSYSNVVGLPLVETLQLLASLSSQ